MTKQELITKIKTWLNDHPNSYDRDINEKVYWTMVDLENMLNSTDSSNVTANCETIFNRFKHYYYKS